MDLWRSMVVAQGGILFLFFRIKAHRTPPLTAAYIPRYSIPHEAGVFYLRAPFLSFFPPKRNQKYGPKSRRFLMWRWKAMFYACMEERMS